MKCCKSFKSVSVTYWLLECHAVWFDRQGRPASILPPTTAHACSCLFFFHPQWIPKLHNRRNFDPHYTFSFIHDLACSYEKVHATMHRRYPRIVGLVTGLENFSHLAYDSISYQFPSFKPLTYLRHIAELNRDVLLAALYLQIHNSTVRSKQTATLLMRVQIPGERQRAVSYTDLKTQKTARYTKCPIRKGILMLCGTRLVHRHDPTHTVHQLLPNVTSRMLHTYMNNQLDVFFSDRAS